VGEERRVRVREKQEERRCVWGERQGFEQVKSNEKYVIFIPNQWQDLLLENPCIRASTSTSTIITNCMLSKCTSHNSV
jgi:hypothetical protein